MSPAITQRRKKNIVPLKDLRVNMERYISRVGKGESFTVVRRSFPIFTLSPVDDESEDAWERIIDFTEINKDGVPAREVLRSLKKLHGKD